MSDAPFTWPPLDPTDNPVSPVILEPNAPAHRASLWHELSELWLAPQAPRLAQRMADAGWSPDAPGAWCDRCAGTVGPHEENEFGCAACRGSRLPWARAVRLGEHRGALRDWVHEVKFTRFRALGTELGRALGGQLRRAGAPREGVIVCPAPTSWRRRVARGIDHSGAIAHGVARELGVPMERLLSRSHRPSQTELPASRRRRNVSGAFRRRGRAGLAGSTVILVDDVMTTGSTARAAARALMRWRGEGSRPGAVWLAVLASAPRSGGEESDASQTIDGQAVAETA